MKYGVIFVDQIKMIQDLPTRIDQDIKFVDIQTWTVFEHYTMNDDNVLSQLGSFNLGFQYVPTDNKTFVDRRRDFKGYKLKAMTEALPPFMSIDLSTSIYDEKSQTYDVTKSVKGLYYDLFLEMQELFNFSATYHKRKDGKGGPVTVLDNGTIIAGGFVQSLTSGFAEVFVTE